MSHLSKALDGVADAGGIAFVVLVGVGYAVFVAPFMPETLAVPDTVAQHLADHPPTPTFWLGMAMEGIGLAALVLFAARIAARIRTGAPESWVPSAVTGLAVAGFTIKLASFAPALAALHVDRYDAGTVTALLDINDAAFDLSWAVDGAFVLLLGLGALATGALPRWVAAWGALSGLGILVGIAVPWLFNPLQPLFLLWLLVTSGWLLVRGRRPGLVAGDRTALRPTAAR